MKKIDDYIDEYVSDDYNDNELINKESDYCFYRLYFIYLISTIIFLIIAGILVFYNI